ncbi:hypothetical protein Cme02nite_03010 [Catellatospora methionotrophica]|uniref:Uncharacterized protein n=1 Tax=Catellatospora methionotrophica TaxID=121620 RepID=A0A8J3L5M2_9ACTN|nr:hypothetical protein Cme02nite_03010 [Catellatospora methionotrophica]
MFAKQPRISAALSGCMIILSVIGPDRSGLPLLIRPGVEVRWGAGPRVVGRTAPGNPFFRRVGGRDGLRAGSARDRANRGVRCSDQRKVDRGRFQERLCGVAVRRCLA